MLIIFPSGGGTSGVFGKLFSLRDSRRGSFGLWKECFEDLGALLGLLLALLLALFKEEVAQGSRGSVAGVSWRGPGGMHGGPLQVLGVFLGVLWGSLGSPWGALGTLGGALGGSWGALGP